MHSATRLSLPWFLVAAPQLTDPHFVRSVVLVVDHGDHGSLGFIVNRPLGIKLSEVVGPRDYEIPGALKAWYGGPVKTDTGIILHHAESSAPSPSSTSIVLTSSERMLRRMCNEAATSAGVRGSSAQRRERNFEDFEISRNAADESMASVIRMNQFAAQDAWQLRDDAGNKSPKDHGDGHPPFRGASKGRGESMQGPLTPYRFLIGYAGWGEGQLEDELRQGAWVQVPYDRELLFDTPPPKMWEHALRNVGVMPRKLVTPTHTYLN